MQTQCRPHAESPSENSHRKKDKDEARNVSLSGDTKHPSRKKAKDECKAKDVDNHDDNPQDDPGKANVADIGDTDDGIFPADSKSKLDVEDSNGDV